MSSEVARFYEGEAVFLTGATGFLGKVGLGPFYFDKVPMVIHSSRRVVE